MSENAMIEQPRRPLIQAEDVNPISMMFDRDISERVMAIAQTMAKGTVTVPNHLRGNTADCLAIVMQAASWRLNPYAVAQKTHLVNGTLGYEAQLVNSVVQSLGLMDGRFQYERIGDWSKVAKRPKQGGNNARQAGWEPSDEDGLGVRVIGKLRGTPDPLTHDLYLVQAWPRNSPLWAVNPFMQLCYLAVKQWVRLYAPDAILGVYTTDELSSEKVIQGEVISDFEPAMTTASATILSAATKKAAEETEPEPEWPKMIAGKLVDVRGVPWIDGVHSSVRACDDHGVWRKRRGVHPETQAKAEAQYLVEPDPEPDPDQEPEIVAQGETDPWLDAYRQAESDPREMPLEREPGEDDDIE